MIRISLGADHAGLPLKQLVAEWLDEHGYDVIDFGVDTPDRVDYPDHVAPAARAVASGDCRFGFVFGGSGTGEQIVANKIDGIRCVQATDPVVARLSREHNDANMMAMGARIIGSQVAIGCLEAFLGGEFQGGRHIQRIEKISAIERDR